MSVLIRDIAEADLPAIVALLHEFAAFENLSEYCEVTEEALRSAMFAHTAVVRGLIATGDGTPIGYALFYPSFSSFRGRRGFFLEDIYVKDEYRGQGVGEAMLKRVAATAREHGAVRLDFLVLDWNATAIGFYEKLGAVSSGGERHFKFDDAAFRALADG